MPSFRTQQRQRANLSAVDAPKGQKLSREAKLSAAAQRPAGRFMDRLRSKNSSDLCAYGEHSVRTALNNYLVSELFVARGLDANAWEKLANQCKVDTVHRIPSNTIDDKEFRQGVGVGAFLKRRLEPWHEEEPEFEDVQAPVAVDELTADAPTGPRTQPAAAQVSWADLADEEDIERARSHLPGSKDAQASSQVDSTPESSWLRCWECGALDHFKRDCLWFKGWKSWGQEHVRKRGHRGRGNRWKHWADQGAA